MKGSQITMFSNVRKIYVCAMIKEKYERSTNNCMFSNVRKIYVCAMIKEKYERSTNNCMFSNVRKIYVCAMIKEKKFFFFFSFLIQFYVPFKLFHSYRDESICRWGKNRSTRGKTT